MWRSHANHLLLIAVMMALASGLAGLVFYQTPPFEACAQLKSSGALDSIPPLELDGYHYCYLTTLEILKSQKVLYCVLDDLAHTAAFSSDKKDAYPRLVRRIQFRYRGTNTIEISFRDRNARCRCSL